MGHGHDHGNLKGKRLAISVFLNVCITAAQTAGGIMSGSLSLLSDALHNFSDIVALLISYVADRLTRKKFTPKQTFGYKRAEIIAAAINASTLLVIAAMLCREAVERISQPAPVNSEIIIYLAGLSILVNGLCVLLLKKEAANSLNIKSAYLHLFSDMLTSVAVMLGGFCIYFFQVYWLDPVLSVIIALYLVWSSWGLLIQTLKVLMQFSPDHLSVTEIENEILKEPLIQNVHHVHLWQLNDHDIHFEAHLDFRTDLPLSQASKIISNISERLQERFSIGHVLLQPEIGIDDSKKLIVEECLEKPHDHH